MDIRKSGLESSDGTKEKWYIFDINNLVIAEFFLPKVWESEFSKFVDSCKDVHPDNSYSTLR